MESIYILILTKIVKWKYIRVIHIIEVFNSDDDTYNQILIYIPYDYAYPPCVRCYFNGCLIQQC